MIKLYRFVPAALAFSEGKEYCRDDYYDMGRGLCYNIMAGLATQVVLIECFKTWPEYSGDVAYPVPSQNSSDPGCVYRKNLYDEYGNQYIGEYGAARLRLLSHRIEYCESRLSESERELVGTI